MSYASPQALNFAIAATASTSSSAAAAAASSSSSVRPVVVDHVIQMSGGEESDEMMANHAGKQRASTGRGAARAAAAAASNMLLSNGPGAVHAPGGAPQLECTGCNKSFEYNYQLTVHLQEHILPYCCKWPLCGVSFAKLDQIVKHVGDHIKVASPEEFVAINEAWNPVVAAITLAGPAKKRKSAVARLDDAGDDSGDVGSLQNGRSGGGKRAYVKKVTAKKSKPPTEVARQPAKKRKKNAETLRDDTSNDSTHAENESDVKPAVVENNIDVKPTKAVKSKKSTSSSEPSAPKPPKKAKKQQPPQQSESGDEPSESGGDEHASPYKFFCKVDGCGYESKKKSDLTRHLRSSVHAEHYHQHSTDPMDYFGTR